MNRRTILVDLDDTCSAAHRREHLIADSWDAFHADLANDEPIFDMVRLLQAIPSAEGGDGIVIVGATARPEKWRQATIEWLARHNVPLDVVLMRPADDFRKSSEVKVDMACAHFGCGPDELKEHILMVIDDNEHIIKAFAGLGVTALQIYARRS